MSPGPGTVTDLFAHGSVDALASRAPVILVAGFVEERDVRASDRAGIDTLRAFAIRETLKGESLPGTRIEVRSAVETTFEDRPGSVRNERAERPPVRAGAEYVLFLAPLPDGTLAYVGVPSHAELTADGAVVFWWSGALRAWHGSSQGPVLVRTTLQGVRDAVANPQPQLPPALSHVLGP